MEVTINKNIGLLRKDGFPILCKIHIFVNVESESSKVDASPEMTSLFGTGKRWRWQVKPQNGIEGEVWLSIFEHQDFILVGGWLRVTGSEPVYVNNFYPCEVRIERDNLDNARFFINSGSQMESGSLSLKDPQAVERHCSTVCAFQGDNPSDCLGIGYVSLRRTVGNIPRLYDGRTLCLQPCIEYRGVRLDPGKDLRLETLLVNTGSFGAGVCLEEWADVTAAVVQPKLNKSIMTGLYNTWYAYCGASKSNHGTEGLILTAAEELVKSGLIHYGICATSLVVFQNRGAFSEHETWPNLIPHGRPWLAQQLAEHGIQLMDGGFWGLVSECATVFQEHPEWMVRDKDGHPKKLGDTSWSVCPYPRYAMDLTQPDAAAWFREHAVRVQARWGCKYFWLDFFGNGEGRTDGCFRTDETVCAPVETLRLITRMVRDELGENCIIGTYTSPTNALVGTVDRVRMATDSGGIPSRSIADLTDGGKGNIVFIAETSRRWKGLQEVARNMAAAYFYHNRLWINDPDPIMVGLEDIPETLEEARTRIMLCANSGGFPTIGEAISQMVPGRLELLKKALPPYGHSARPVDLMEHDVPSIHHLRVPHPAGEWQVISLFNWDNIPQTFTVNLDNLGLPGEYHAFEFWTQEYTGVVKHELKFTVLRRAVRVLRLTLVSDHPQVIGTDRHVAVGIKELPFLHWNHTQGMLSGGAVRPLPEKGIITFFVPNGWKIDGVKGVELEIQGNVVRGSIEFIPQGKRWQLKCNNFT